jgi:hypothetical protein
VQDRSIRTDRPAFAGGDHRQTVEHMRSGSRQRYPLSCAIVQYQTGAILSGGWRPEEGQEGGGNNAYDAVMTRVEDE